MLRQGDVLLIPSKCPQDTKPVESVNGRNVLAEGEATGHAHTTPDGATALLESPDGRRYLKVEEVTSLTHQEHEAIELWPQEYEVRRQREYSPEAIRNVAD